MSGTTSTIPQGAAGQHGVFATTRWTAVLSARDAHSPDCESSLEALCRAYWYPLYAYVRRQGHTAHDAQDLTQEFFSCLLRKNYLNAADPGKGRFRTFLIVALQRFLSNDWDRARAQKRGGGQAILSLDAREAEQLYLAEPAIEQSPDRVFERRWALTILGRTMAALRREFAASGKESDFEHLKAFLTVDAPAPACSELAAKLGLSEGAARVAIHRVRKRFREVFREEISHTVARAEDVDEEIRHLLSALAQ